MSFGDLERSGGYGGGYQQNSGFNPGGRDGDGEYIRLNERLTQSIQHISNNVATLQKMTSLFGTPKDTLELRERMHELSHVTKELITTVQNDLKAMSRIDGGSASENRTRKMQQTKLANDFKDVIKRFADVQKISAAKEREFVAQAKKAQTARHDQLVPSDEDSTEDSTSLITAEQRRQQALALENELAHNEAIIQETEEGIREIESNLITVNEIQRDIARLLHEQGAMVDTIAGNIDQAESQTFQAKEELTGASKYQKAARNKMCILLLILIIVAAIITLVVVMKST